MDSTTEAQLGVIRVLAATLRARNLRWWLFGGWGLDALLGRVTREHGDIEIWIERGDATAVRDALVQAGARALDTQPIEEACEYVLDGVLFSSAFFDRAPDGTFRCQGRQDDWIFPVGSFAEDVGHLEELTVPVMSAAGMLAMKQQFASLRNGRPLRDKDVRDIAVLVELITG